MKQQPAPLDTLFHALSDPTRRAVVQRLGHGAATVSELAGPFDMAMPSFLQHVRLLEDAGVIRTEKTGRVRTCTLEPERLALIEDWLNAQRDVWKSRYDKLDTLLATLTEEDKNET
ncbi:MAG: ArsR/SmtB family transcription factor [Sagittula sp.]|uniref:ArsR/SmtB family transcription factor n=1 Tax=Sagittula sp. TaxID=2038081 RepID=UPI0035141B9D